MMPHKHKRKRGDGSTYDLPPSQKARPLPAFSGNRGSRTDETRKAKKRRVNSADKNDVPRAFRRIMDFAQGKKALSSGLDDGKLEGTGSKLRDCNQDKLRIKSGENMRTFAARVDAALPIAGLATKVKTIDGKDALGFKVQRTRKERKMHKLYEQWRAEDRKIQEKKEEEKELSAARAWDETPRVSTSNTVPGEVDELPGRNKRGSKRDRKQDDDPWLELIHKRKETKPGLHDVALAPPDLLHSRARKQLRVAGAVVDVENVPKAAGSLRRREDLQVARNNVMETFRKIREHEHAKMDMRGRRGQKT